MSAKRGYASPLGLNRYALLTIYAAFLTLTTNVFSTPILVIAYFGGSAFLEEAGLLLEPLRQIEQLSCFAYIAPICFTLFASFVAHPDEPSFSFRCGVVLHVFGLLLIQIKENIRAHYFGVLLIGVAANVLTTSVSSLTYYWPHHSNLVEDVLGSACELATLVPWIWIAANRIPLGNYEDSTYLLYVLCIGVIGFLMSFFLLPQVSFQYLCTRKYAAKMASEPPKQRNGCCARIARIAPLRWLTKNTSVRQQFRVPLLFDRNHIEKFCSPAAFRFYAASALIFLINFHFLISFTATASADAYENTIPLEVDILFILYGTIALNAFSWVPNLFVSHIADLSCSFVFCAWIVFWFALAFLLLISGFKLALLCVPVAVTCVATLGYNYMHAFANDLVDPSSASVLVSIASVVVGLAVFGYQQIANLLDNPSVSTIAAIINHLPTDVHVRRLFYLHGIAFAFFVILCVIFVFDFLAYRKVIRVFNTEDGKKVYSLICHALSDEDYNSQSDSASEQQGSVDCALDAPMDFDPRFSHSGYELRNEDQAPLLSKVSAQGKPAQSARGPSKESSPRSITPQRPEQQWQCVRLLPSSQNFSEVEIARFRSLVTAILEDPETFQGFLEHNQDFAVALYSALRQSHPTELLDKINSLTPDFDPQEAGASLCYLLGVFSSIDRTAMAHALAQQTTARQQDARAECSIEIDTDSDLDMAPNKPLTSPHDSNESEPHSHSTSNSVEHLVYRGG